MPSRNERIIVVISSFPRSGTHFLIDNLRLNFREFNYRPPPWASSELLYYNLDRHVIPGKTWATGSLDRDNIIVKAHRLPFEPALQQHLHEIADGRRIEVLTPVRPLSRMLASYWRYQAPDILPAEFLGSRDRFYDDGRSVREAVADFYTSALEQNTLIDVQHGSSNLDGMINALAARLGLQRNPGPARAVPRRQSSGRLAQLSSRLRGHPASEVIVRKDGLPEVKSIDIGDGALLELDKKLAEAAINQVPV